MAIATDKTDATPTVGDHAAHHNELAAAVNALTALGATDVELSAAVAAAVAALTTAIAAKQDSSTAATDAELASAIAGVQAAVDALGAAGATDAEVATAVAVVSGVLATHQANTANPHAVTKAQVGLANADNTSDAGKPVSTAQQAAITLAGGDIIVAPAPNGTDDTTALQTWLTALTSGQTGQLRAGTYLITAAMKYNGGTALRGSGWGRGSGTTIKQKNGANIVAVGGSLTGLLVPLGWSNNVAASDGPVSIENIAVDGNVANNPSSTACGVVLCNYWSQIARCYIHDTPLHGIHMTDTTQNGSTQIVNSASENHVMDNKIASIGGHGISQICANTISNQDGRCLDNNISAVGLDGISFQRGSGWVFRRNHLYNVQRNGIELLNCYATVVRDNEIEDFGNANATGVFYDGIGVQQLNRRGTVVSGNFVGCAEPAANVSTYQYVSVTTGPAQTDAHAIVTDNIVLGPATPTAQGRAILLQTSSGGLTVVASNNRVSSVNTEVFVGTGVTVTQRNYGKQTTDGDTATRHILASGSTPTITLGAAAGTGPSASSVAGVDTAMSLAVTTGTATATGRLFTVTYATAYASAPRGVVPVPSNAASAACAPFVSNRSATAFEVHASVAPATSTPLAFQVVVVG